MAVAAVVLAVAAGGACGSGEDRPGQITSENNDDDHAHEEETAEEGDDEETPPAFADDAATAKVDATLRDYAFVGIPPTVKGPNVLFTAEVAGSNTHELEVVDGAGDAVAEIPPFKTGAERKLTVVLEPGTYTVQCLVKEGTRTHAQLGMKQPLTVE